MNKIVKEAKEIDKEYNTFITLNESLEKGKPIVIKDNICTKGIKTTAGSKILENYIPVFDATVIEKLKSKGFSILGKTVQDAFGFGSFSTNCAYKTPKNPFDKERVCGGSSGGTAAFIKLSKNVKYGLGQSTGGSINCPSAFCGVVGLTPTYGLVSRYGLIDYANSFDRIGPITKNVKDAAYLLSIMAGEDKRDQTTQNKAENYTKYCGSNVKGMKIGLIKEAFSNDVQKEVKSSVLTAIKKFKKLNCKVEEVSFPSLKYVVPVYYILAMAEASTNLAKYCGLRYGKEKKIEGFYDSYFSDVRSENFGKEEKRRILLGTFIRMVGYRDDYYIKALKLRNKIISDFKKLFKKFDVLVTPTMPLLPPKFSEIKNLSPAEIYSMDFLTIPASLVGAPSMSIPVGEVKGLPVGMQLIANYFEEGKLIKLGDAYEKK
ncbi:Asp-tRNA(Asn)/Glu-tRNA(Gln) amidotransferase GatCAB subunit A [archaeon]|nr:Asp-tRNA(Asn)/Glu-tRNA(Gln) amidotransferase GatCAB subunit A [archaeon]|tara:strand:+ start:1493 stop:2788 length:1296 start_codon:yes stop_codon:yes gene_type:complete